MQRRVLGFLAAAVLMAVSASPALADPGAPGTTFPEQPGNNAETACVAVTTNPGSGVGGSTEGHISPTAAAITGGLIVDACFGG